MVTEAVKITMSSGYTEIVNDDSRILGFYSDKPNWRSGNLLHIGDYIVLDVASGLPYVGKYSDDVPVLTDVRLVRVVGINVVD